MAPTRKSDLAGRIESPEPEAFIYDESSSGRVKVVQYAETSKFLPGDRVWYRDSRSGTKQGKFIVVKGPSAGKYYLAAIDNVSVLVLGGKVVSENELELEEA